MKEREYSGCEIAIIGMSGRFPGANSIEAYWQNLKNGISAIRFLDDEELLSKGVERRSLQKPGYVKVCSMLDDIELFDASFFGYTPREATLMDPQHRIFLECAWEALESAGYSPEKTAEIISVFASATTNTYLLYNLLSNPELLDQLDPVQIDVSNGNDYLATRVSYKLNLTGPSCTVQSACSSSLVAVHMACQNLLNQESDIAIAGGISIDVRQQCGYQYSEGSIVSPDGYCRAFDAKANGTVFGSGLGVVVLRRLEDALAKGDTIFAIIKGSAMNNDGAGKVGYTAPGVDGQAAVIAEALSVAGCGAETISYVETHGTGTKMGDPVEIRALVKAFKQTTTKKNYCAIGSVKTQIGHLAGAAGISSLIKTVLALHNRQIPASLNFNTPNPEIDFASTPFFVNTELKEWEHPLRRAGVSSFGVGGTNVHLVLEEAPEVKVTDSVRNYHLLPLSAKTENALTLTREALVESLRQNSGLNLADVTFTLQTGRKDFNYRLFAVCSDINEAVAILQSGDKSKIGSSFIDLENRRVVFVFPGEDNQHHLPCGLYEHEPLFREKYDKCLNILNELLSKIGQPNVRITRQSIYEPGALPTLKKIDHFITEYSLANFLITIGIIPEAMIGEGVGEYTAACVAGVLSVEQVILLYLGQDLSAENNIFEQAHFDFPNAIRQLQRNAPKISFISAISGNWISDSEALSADYWLTVRNTTSQFTSGLLKITDDETEKIFLQIGRCSFTLDSMESPLENALICRTNNDYQGNESDVSSFFYALGELWLKGVKIDWQGLYKNENRRRIPLPTYPFMRERYWIERKQQCASEEDGYPSVEKNIVKENDPDNWFYFPGWKSSNLPDKDYIFEQEEKWLIFCDQSPLSSELDRYLKANKQRVILVYAGGSFQTLAKDCYSIHPGQQRDYQALFAALKDEDIVPNKLIHLWSLNNDTDYGKDSLTETTTNFFDAQIKGFWSVIFTAIALEKPSLPDFSYQMWIITDYLFEVENNDTIFPEKATLLSPVRVIPIEYPHINCYCLDVNQANISSSGVIENVSRIFKEIQTAGSDKIIAFRGKRRWLPNYEQIQLKEVNKPLRREGVYLVTDDSNGICLLIAEYLVKTCQAKVLLIEDNSFPDRGSWSLWTNKEDTVGNKIQKIMDLEETGRLQCNFVNLSDYEQVEQSIKRVIESYGVLHGVIHGADDFNHTGFYPIQEIDYEKPTDYFNLKINSVYHLKKALAPYKLDFLMLISSLSPLLGGLGQIINAAQCSFLDSFASHEGAYWVSVNWDIWQLTGKNRRLQEGIYKDAIEPDEGIRAFLKIITAYTGNRLIVSTTNLQMRLLQLSNIHSNMNETEKKSVNIKHPRPELKTLFIAPVSETEKKLAAIWENCLGIDKIGIDDNFFDLGGDSLISINVMNEISSAFDRKIPAAILYQKATIRDLSQLLGEEDASAKQMNSEILNKRKEALSRRNQLLNKRHQLKFSEGEGNDE